MMENRTDKNSYTILFSIGMVLAVGALLAFTAASLKPKITENQRIEKQQNILYAMGVNDNTESSAVFISTKEASEAFSKYITKQLVIQNGQVEEDPMAYLIDIKKEKSAAREDVSKRRLPLFVGEKDGVTHYVIPI